MNCFKGIIHCLATICFFIPLNSHAITYDITVLTGNRDGGFGYSLLHSASSSNRMGGTHLGDITGGGGSFSNGHLDANLELSNDETLHLYGELDFFSTNTDKWLDTTAHLTADFSGTTFTDTTFTFTPGDQCCAGNHDPNSFSDIFITLWGTNGWTGDANSPWQDVDLGMDLRLKLTEVPLPSSLILFGSVLFGFGTLKIKENKYEKSDL